jgi:hypothetical protein
MVLMETTNITINQHLLNTSSSISHEMSLWHFLLARMTTWVIFGKLDQITLLADPLDVQTLMAQLPITPYYHNEPTYAHADFLLAPSANADIYQSIISLIHTVGQDFA